MKKENKTMRTTNSNVRGVGFLLITILLFSFQGIAVKWIGDGYPVMEIVLIRTLVALPCTLLLLRFEGLHRLPKSPQLKLQIVRSLYLFLSYTTAFMGLVSISLAEIASIRNSGPLMITLLSVLLLDEKVGPRRWLALIVGFVGVLLIIRPGSASFNLGSIFTLLSVLFYALSVMVTRKLQTTDSGATMAYYSSLVYLAAALILAPLAIFVGEMPGAHPSIAFLFRSWAMPSPSDWAIMAGLGLLWALAMYFVARAYSLAQASVAAPFEYMSLPLNVMWDFLIWHQVPTLMTWGGALLTIFSGVYILVRDQQTVPIREAST
jgi:drug/metabolite transporter (DMT)-like permease